MALGADHGRVAGLVLREGGRLFLWDLGVRGPLTVATALALCERLDGVAPLDPLILSRGAGVLALITCGFRKF